MKYEVYLTKSREVAEVISKAFKVGENGIHSVAYGDADSSDAIPPMYATTEWACCVVTYNGDADVQPYRLVIA